MDQQEDIKIIELTTRMQHYKKLNETASNLLGAIKDSDDPQTRIDLYKSTNCYMCSTYFDSNVVKCRDHSHQTSKYLGAACQSCNLRRHRPTKLKIFAHNGSRYKIF